MIDDNSEDGKIKRINENSEVDRQIDNNSKTGSKKSGNNSEAGSKKGTTALRLEIRKWQQFLGWK